MKKLLAAFLLASASLAHAHCPDAITCEMKAIDSSLAAASSSTELLEKVKAMRAEGQKLLDAGREREALNVLKEARKLLKEGS
jgi:hypothetical protein